MALRHEKRHPTTMTTMIARRRSWWERTTPRSRIRDMSKILSFHDTATLSVVIILHSPSTDLR